MRRNKKHYIKNKKSVIMNSFDNGGLNFLDFYTLNNTLKINWLKQFIKNPSSIWNFIPILFHIIPLFSLLSFLFCHCVFSFEVVEV